jgi:glycine/D-amino acid oxidase-like deaminating enzyme/nitrite reductase/ring-hydroxylating ferredoxin subunit
MVGPVALLERVPCSRDLVLGLQTAVRMKPAETHDGATISSWMGGVEVPSTQPLAAPARVDVCVIGGGIAGLSVAYELSVQGKLVMVLEAGEIGGGQTGRTTAHLASALDDRFTELERLHGEEGARLAAQSHQAAITRIETIAHTEQISCDLQRVDGYLFLAPGDEAKLLELELAAARRAGLRAELLPRAPLPFDTGPCLEFPMQAQFHPLKYVAGLARAILARGGLIHTDTRVATIDGPRIVTQTGLEIVADQVVVATNVPVNDVAVIHTKQAAYRSYVIAAEIPSGSIPPGLFWDTHEPYHYVRTHRSDEGTLLIVGGEDHKTGQDDDPELRWPALESWARTRFPSMGEVEHRWSGQIIEPADGLAFIGRNPGDSSNVYVVTGDSGHGMTHGVIAGMLICDLISGRPNPWETLYDPRRRTLRALGEFAKENLNTIAQYADWLKKGDVEGLEDIPLGEGAIVRRGAQLLAVYRSEVGAPTVCSAVCTHLKGIVRWNRAEGTWDCPCHGARYSREGDVVEGPAIVGLERVSLARLLGQPEPTTAPEPGPQAEPLQIR